MVKTLETALVGVEKNVLVGGRHDLRNILEEEAASGKGDMAVIVSGPAGMSDEVRCLVSEISKRSRRPIKLIEESFYW